MAAPGISWELVQNPCSHIEFAVPFRQCQSVKQRAPRGGWLVHTFFQQLSSMPDSGPRHSMSLPAPDTCEWSPVGPTQVDEERTSHGSVSME